MLKLIHPVFTRQALEDPAAQIRARLEKNGSSGGNMPAPPTTRQDMLNNVPRAG